MDDDCSVFESRLKTLRAQARSNVNPTTRAPPNKTSCRLSRLEISLGKYLSSYYIIEILDNTSSQLVDYILV